MKKFEDLKAFIWYLTTEPFRGIKREAHNFFKGTTATLTNVRLWGDFLIVVSIFSLMLRRFDFAGMFVGVGLFMRLYYEYRRKYYRHLWKERKLNKLKDKKEKR